jgi:UBX domain-containing protein 7
VDHGGVSSVMFMCCDAIGRFAPPPAAALGDGMLQGLAEEDDVRAPLPVKRDTLYGDAPMAM